MATTLVTGGTGFIGSHLARALAERGDELRVLARRSSSLEALAGIDYERATGDITDRRAVRRARRRRRAGVSRRRPDLASPARSRRRLGGERPRGANPVRGGAHSGGGARGPHLHGGRDRRRRTERGDRRDRDVQHRPPWNRLRELQARGRAGGPAGGRAGPSGGDRQPLVRAGSRRAAGNLDGPRPALPPAPDSRLRGRGAQHRGRPRRRRRPPARRSRRARSGSATSSRAGTSRSTGCSRTSPGSRASSRHR